MNLPVVLVVEDEESLGRAMCHFVETSMPDAVRCLRMNLGAEAISFLSSDDGIDVRLMIVDLNLGLSDDVSGREVIRRAFTDRKDLRGHIVVCSGETLPEDDPVFTDFGCARLDKPFEVERLREMLEEAIDVPRP